MLRRGQGLKGNLDMLQPYNKGPPTALRTGELCRVKA